jgi:ArsR family transcriptional regulator
MNIEFDERRNEQPMSPYAALVDPTRRGILKLLREGSRPAGEIAAAFHQSAPTISHHLKVLERAGLVRSERRGTRIVYALQATALQEVAAEILDLASGLRPRPARS